MTADSELAQRSGVSRPEATELAARPGRSVFVTTLFAITAFMGAGLLFVVQPMVARIVLPDFGGSATVWSTCSLFFQFVLLLGYLYVHETTTRLPRRAHLWVHATVLLLPLAVLPVTVPTVLGHDGPPALRLLGILALMIGLPFAVLSTTGPLLQRWYSWTSAARSDDPYFLFAASNLGSFGGLLAYPLVLERALTVDQQRTTWSVGFVVFLVLVAVCGGLVARSSRSARLREPEEVTLVGPASGPTAPASRSAQLTWLGLAFLPSALLLAVTSHMSTDVAAVPLLWVIPLALYLATFVVAFARRSRSIHPMLVRGTVALAALVLAASYLGFPVPIGVAIGLDLVVLTLVAFVSHARLAALRPPVEQLTRFYLVVATGGALGGLLNGLVAPMVFDRVWEYPGMLLASLLLGIGVLGATRSPLERRYGRRGAIGLQALAVTAAGVVVVGLASAVAGSWWIGVLVVVGVWGAWLAATSPLALGIGMFLLVAVLTGVHQVGTVETVRTFYGAYRVSDADGIRRLQHGNTSHGSQVLADPTEPTMYYARSGPLGAVMDSLDHTNTAVVGLGTGTIAAYGEMGDTLTYYEIDPEIVAMATDPRLFTYVRDSKAKVSTVVGDGRLRLEEAPDASYDLIVLDAFSSDAVPVHLLTEEAFDLYARKLAPGGAIVVHISNRYLDLEPVIAASADHLGWDSSVSVMEGKVAPPAVESHWVLVTGNGDSTATLRERHGWRAPGAPRLAWTDDYSSVLAALLAS